MIDGLTRAGEPTGFGGGSRANSLSIPMSSQHRAAVPTDYDSQPSRFHIGSDSPWKYGTGDVHEDVAERLAGEQAVPVLDLACGEGRLMRLLSARSVDVVGLDRSPTMLQAAPGKRVLGDAQALPFQADSYGGVAALYFLYHLSRPELALREAHRILRPGGLFVAATPSRDNHPEFARFIMPKSTTFDAEEAPEIVARVFIEIEVARWDGPFINLPDRDALTEYLFGRGLNRVESAEIARSVKVPMQVTKRGCLVWGRKDG